jgi:DNA-binding LacI/PurR family transcriptional regulator
MGLTTVKQQLHGSGKEAALLVNKHIKDPLIWEPREIFLPLELIIRRST